MPNIAEIRRDLKVTQKDLAGVINPKLRELMAQTPNVGFSVGSNYAFQCACCSAIDDKPVFYNLLKEVVGSGITSGETDVKKIRSARGIERIKDLGFTPEYSSLLHITKEGMVCDHCHESVYSVDLF